MLIENVEQELDPLLDPVLERRFLRKGRQVTVQLADKEVRAASKHVRMYTDLPRQAMQLPNVAASAAVLFTAALQHRAVEQGATGCSCT